MVRRELGGREGSRGSLVVCAISRLCNLRKSLRTSRTVAATSPCLPRKIYPKMFYPKQSSSARCHAIVHDFPEQFIPNHGHRLDHPRIPLDLVQERRQLLERQSLAPLHPIQPNHLAKMLVRCLQLLWFQDEINFLQHFLQLMHIFLF